MTDAQKSTVLTLRSKGMSFSKIAVCQHDKILLQQT